MGLKGGDLGLLALGLKKQSFINFGIHATVTSTTWVQYSLVMSGSYIFVTYLEAYFTLKLCKICVSLVRPYFRVLNSSACLLLSCKDVFIWKTCI